MEVEGREKHSFPRGISRDRACDKARVHHGVWPDLGRETEGDPNLTPDVDPGKEHPSMP